MIEISISHPLTTKLTENISSVLIRSNIPHKCFVNVRDYLGEWHPVNIAIPNGRDPIAVILCMVVDDYEKEFLERYGVSFKTKIRGLDQLTTFLINWLCDLCIMLKENRRSPLFIAALISSVNRRISGSTLRRYMRAFDEVFTGFSSVSQLPSLLTSVLGNPLYPVKTFKSWTDTSGQKHLRSGVAMLGSPPLI